MTDVAFANDLTSNTEHGDAAGAEAPGDSSVTLDLDALFTKHHRRLQRFVMRYVRNPDDAEDLVQSAFLEALRCAEQFSGLSQPSTWLFGIALNLARNQIRRKCTSACDLIEDWELEQIIDQHCVDPVAVIESRQTADKVERLLGRLDPDIRATFEAVLEGETTYEEAARQLQIPIGTVRSRVSRVRAAVRAECL